MENKKKTVYLMAGGPGDSRGSMTAFMKQALADCDRPNPAVAYIGTASEDDHSFFLFLRKMILKAGASDCFLVPLCRKNPDIEKEKERMAEADAIFLSGGEVDEGAERLQQLGLCSCLKDLREQGKVFFGLSAGSIMMGENWAHWEKEDVDSTSSLISCLGLVPYTFDTHCESENWRELKQVLRLKGDGAVGYGIQSGNMATVDAKGKLSSVFPLDSFINQKGKIVSQ